MPSTPLFGAWRRLVLASLLCPALIGHSQPATEDSVREMMKMTRVRELVQAAMKQADDAFLAQMRSLPLAESPEAQKSRAEVQKKVRNLITDEFDWEKIEQIEIRICQDSLTEPEIRGIIDFYRTPAGEALINKLPAINQRTLQEMQTLSRRVAAKARAIVAEAAEQTATSATIDTVAKAAVPGAIPNYKQAVPATPGDICFRTDSVIALMDLRGDGSQGMLHKDCRYYTSNAQLEAQPVFDPKSAAIPIGISEVMRKAYRDYYAKYGIAEGDFFRMASIALQKVDDYTLSKTSEELRQQPERLRNLWFYVVTCTWPSVRVMKTYPAPAVVLLNGDLVVATEALVPITPLSPQKR